MRKSHDSDLDSHDRQFMLFISLLNCVVTHYRGWSAESKKCSLDLTRQILTNMVREEF